MLKLRWVRLMAFVICVQKRGTKRIFVRPKIMQRMVRTNVRRINFLVRASIVENKDIDRTIVGRRRRINISGQIISNRKLALKGVNKVM